MYAIVKAGGHQEKVEVGDVILVNRLDAKKGDTVEFPVSLVVDGDKVTLAAADLAKVSVKAEVVTTKPRARRLASRSTRTRLVLLAVRVIARS